jgi:hypothetical protein
MCIMHGPGGSFSFDAATQNDIFGDALGRPQIRLAGVTMASACPARASVDIKASPQFSLPRNFASK